MSNIFTHDRRHRRPLISLPNERSHVVFNGSQLIDKCGQAWTMQGTVPMVAASGRNPPGAGPFSTSNYFETANIADNWDSDGDFTAAFVMKRGNVGTAEGLHSGYGTSTAGYYVVWNGSSLALNQHGGGSAQGVSLINAGFTTAPNVVCVGRRDNLLYLKANLNPTAIVETTNDIVSYTTADTRLGLWLIYPLLGVLYEAVKADIAPSSALFLNIANSVKTRLGITAW